MYGNSVRFVGNSLLTFWILGIVFMLGVAWGNGDIQNSGNACAASVLAVRHGGKIEYIAPPLTLWTVTDVVFRNGFDKP